MLDSKIYFSKTVKLIHLVDEESVTRPDTKSSESAGRYASFGVLSPFFPAADPRTPESRQSRPWYSRQDSVLILGSIVAVIVFLVNFTALLVFRIRFPSSTIYRGDCKRVYIITSALHAAINLLSTLLLAASNKSMQVLAAPTRERGRSSTFEVHMA